MKVVKILQDTIRKNPDAGRTSFRVPINQEVRFIIKDKLPSYLIDGKNVHITDQIFSSESETYKGILIDPSLSEQLLKDGAQVDWSQDFQIVRHLIPEPEYLYEYDNPTIKCNGGHEVPLNDIMEDCDDNGCWLTCPVCSEIDSFEEFRYEKISEALAP
jgi:hypothetical protein